MILISRIIPVTDKQKQYAYEYFHTKDPLLSYVKAGYASSIEEAKKKKGYTSPLKSKAVQQCLSYYKKEYTIYHTTINLHANSSIDSKKYLSENYLEGIDIPQFLRDIICDSHVRPKDRLEATKMLIEFTKNHTKKIIIVDDLEMYNKEVRDKK